MWQPERINNGFREELLFELPEEKKAAGSVLWNPWHGCRKYSAGCANCYVYRIDRSHGKDASLVNKTKSFSLPLEKKRGGHYRIPYGSFVYTCFSSDFFLDLTDEWRPQVWEMMRLRADLRFFIITKRISRASSCLPVFWHEIKERVDIACTIENQKEADSRLDIYRNFPVCRHTIICEPLVGPVVFSSLEGIDKVSVGGESGPDGRLCSFSWVLSLRRQCQESGVSFFFKQTGTNFEKEGKVYHIPRALQQPQALKAGINLP